jgi:hypothetical protein
MKNFVTVLFAGAVLATAAFAQGTNNWANELNRAKLGRGVAASECECGMSCCSHKTARTAVVVAHNDAAERAQLKTGIKPAAGMITVASVPAAHNDAQERASLKTGRVITPAAAPVEIASECVRMGCCKS